MLIIDILKNQMNKFKYLNNILIIHNQYKMYEIIK